MGLQASIKKAVQSAFVAIGDLKIDVNYWKKGDAERNSTTRVLESTDNVYALSVVFIDFEIKKIDDEAIRKGDVEVYFPADDLPVEPELADYMEEVDTGITWNVINKRLDPAKALWILHVRKR